MSRPNVSGRPLVNRTSKTPLLPGQVVTAPNRPIIDTPVPSAMTGFSATAASASQINVAWTDPNNNEIAVIVERSLDGSTGWTEIARLPGGSSVDSDTGLPANSTRYYRVWSYNVGGSSPYSSVQSATTGNVSAPAAPTGLTATPSSDATGLYEGLSWTAPAGTVTSYDVARSTNGGSTFSVIGSPAANSYKDYLISPGQNVQYKVRAVNGGGSSAYTAPLSVTVPSIPAAPSSLQVTPSSSTTLLVTLTNNANNATAILIERSLDGSTGWSQITSLAGNGTSYSDTSLSAGATRYYRAKARNAAGDSGYSNVAFGTTQAAPGTAPGTPTAITATLSGSNVVVAFTPGSNTDSVHIERSYSGGITWLPCANVPASVTSWTDRSLYRGFTVHYRLRGVNVNGMSGFSSTVNVASVPRGFTAAPATPTNLTAIAASDTSVSLCWERNDRLDETWKLEQSPNGTTGWVQIATTGRAVLQKYVTGLTAGTSYSFRVRGSNSFGDSSYSNVASVTTLASGHVYSPTGRNPRYGWLPQWQSGWLAAQTAYNNNPADTSWPVLAFAQLKSKADSFISQPLSSVQQPYCINIPDPALWATVMYQITGDATTYGTPALTYWLYKMVEHGTVTSGSATTTSFPCDLSNRWSNAGGYGRSRVYWLTGANAGTYSFASSFTSPTVTLQVSGQATALANVPSVGDTFVVLRGQLEPGWNVNEIRDSFVHNMIALDWLRSLMSGAQVTDAGYVAKWLADFAAAYGCPQFLGGFRVGLITNESALVDSDQCCGQYFGTALADSWPSSDWPVAGTLLSRTAVNNGNGLAVPLGGLDATAPDWTTVRNTVEYLLGNASGGAWMESGEYDPGTQVYLASGCAALWTALQVEHFPRVRDWYAGMCDSILHMVSPDATQRIVWGDDDQTVLHGWYQPVIDQTLAEMTGLTRGDNTISPYVHQLLFENWTGNVGGTAAGQPYPRAYLFWSPDQPRTDWRSAAPKSWSVPGRGMATLHTGWTGSDSMCFLFGYARTNADHETYYGPTTQLYRKGELAMVNPYGYNTVLWYPESQNTAMFAGQQMEYGVKGASAVEVGSGNAWMLMQAGGHGAQYDNHFFQPPSDFRYEWTRTWFYLPDASGQQSDTLVSFDRMLMANPKNLPNLTRYRGYNANPASATSDYLRLLNANALVETVWHTPVSPTLSGGQSTWTTTGGQKCAITHLGRTTLGQAIVNEATLWGGNVKASEEHYHVRTWDGTTPWPAGTAAVRLDHVDVFQCCDSGVTLTAPSLVSATGTPPEAKAVWIQRPSLPDYFLMVGTRAVGRFQYAGWTITLAPATSTASVVIADLSPDKSWTYTDNGGASTPLTVSVNGVATLSLSGSGNHTLVFTAS